MATSIMTSLINPLRTEFIGIVIKTTICILNVSSASTSHHIGAYLHMNGKPVSCTFQKYKYFYCILKNPPSTKQ